MGRCVGVRRIIHRLPEATIFMKPVSWAKQVYITSVSVSVSAVTKPSSRLERTNFYATLFLD